MSSNTYLLDMLVFANCRIVLSMPAKLSGADETFMLLLLLLLSPSSPLDARRWCCTWTQWRESELEMPNIEDSKQKRRNTAGATKIVLVVTPRNIWYSTKSKTSTGCVQHEGRLCPQGQRNTSVDVLVNLSHKSKSSSSSSSIFMFNFNLLLSCLKMRSSVSNSPWQHKRSPSGQQRCWCLERGNVGCSSCTTTVVILSVFLLVTVVILVKLLLSFSLSPCIFSSDVEEIVERRWNFCVISTPRRGGCWRVDLDMKHGDKIGTQDQITII